MNKNPQYIVETIFDDVNPDDLMDTDDYSNDVYYKEIQNPENVYQLRMVVRFHPHLIINRYDLPKDKSSLVFNMEYIYTTINDVLENSVVFRKSDYYISYPIRYVLNCPEQTKEYKFPLLSEYNVYYDRTDNMSYDEYYDYPVYFNKIDNIPYKKFINDIYNITKTLDKLLSSVTKSGTFSSILFGSRKETETTNAIDISPYDVYNSYNIKNIYEYCVNTKNPGDISDDSEKTLLEIINRYRYKFLYKARTKGVELARQKYNLDINILCGFYDKYSHNRYIQDTNGLVLLDIKSATDEKTYDWAKLEDCITECILMNIPKDVVYYTHILFAIRTPLIISGYVNTNPGKRVSMKMEYESVFVRRGTNRNISYLWRFRKIKDNTHRICYHYMYICDKNGKVKTNFDELPDVGCKKALAALIDGYVWNLTDDDIKEAFDSDKSVFDFLADKY